MRSAWCSFLPGTWVPRVHAVCPHNELSSVFQRVLAPLPVPLNYPLGQAVLREFARVKRLAGRYGGETWSYLQTASSYHGRLRRRYMAAEESLRESPVSSRDARLSPFLKAEKCNVDGKLPKPRMIWPRSPRYNLALASRLKPFEHWLWGRLDARTFAVPGVGRIVAKGLNPRRRANLIVRKFARIEDCVVFEADGKAFEAHVLPAQLSAEHGVYHSAFPGDGGLFALLAMQLVLRAKLMCGAKISRPGSRASGDFNTGMGNTLIFSCIVVAALRELCGSKPFDLLVDGDNCIVFIPRSVLGRVVSSFAPTVLQMSGHEVVLERPVAVIEQIVFGQSHPVFLGPGRGWVMTRDWRKVFSVALSSHRWLHDPSFGLEWVQGVAACELSLSRGLPVLQRWALEIQARFGVFCSQRRDALEDYFVVGAWLAGGEDRLEVLPECRLSFERAFGLSPEEQDFVESGLAASLAGASVSGPWAHFPDSFDQDEAA